MWPSERRELGLLSIGCAVHLLHERIDAEGFRRMAALAVAGEHARVESLGRDARRLLLRLGPLANLLIQGQPLLRELLLRICRSRLLNRFGDRPGLAGDRVL